MPADLPYTPSQAPQATQPGPQANAELIDYFIKTGMNPVVAAGTAARIMKSAPPPEPISNGIQIHPNDAVMNLLVNKYGVSPEVGKEIVTNMYQNRSNLSPIQLQLQQEAMKGVAANVRGNLADMADYAKSLVPDAVSSADRKARGVMDPNWKQKWREYDTAHEAERRAKYPGDYVVSEPPGAAPLPENVAKPNE